jgi:hypothetical protein
MDSVSSTQFKRKNGLGIFSLHSKQITLRLNGLAPQKRRAASSIPAVVPFDEMKCIHIIITQSPVVRAKFPLLKDREGSSKCVGREQAIEVATG